MLVIVVEISERVETGLLIGLLLVLLSVGVEC